MLVFCLTMLGPAPDEMMDGVLGCLLPDPDQGITDLLDSLRYNLAALVGPKYDVTEIFHCI